MKPLTCPSCLSKEVEKIKVNSTEGRRRINNLIAARRNPIARGKIIHVKKEHNESAYLYHCKKCNYLEIWDVLEKSALYKAHFGKVSKSLQFFQKISKNKKDLIVGLIIAAVLAGFSIPILTALEFFGQIDIPLVDLNNNSALLIIIDIIAVISSIFISLILSYGVLYLIDKKIEVLEFTYKLHNLAYGDHLYYLEFHSKEEKTNIASSFLRALFGSILILGLSVLVIENFLTIQSLKPYLEEAIFITIICVGITLPVIMITLYISPLLTKEINLYFHDAHERTVKNVGEWLDQSLQLFAVLDIILTIIILLDSDMPASWFVVIICLVLLLFSLFLVFTIIFNRYYHARLKNKFLEHLKGKYHIPIKKISLFNRYYYCWNCGELTDAIQQNSCLYCGASIHKCSICNEVLHSSSIAKKRSENSKSADVMDRMLGLADRMQSKMAGSFGEEFPYVECPHCYAKSHVDELLSWLRMHDNKCPVCKTEINFYDIIPS
ncbi:MAG: hypothetical protein ACFFCS_04765 [Candidatus Hodarchaeota archaeon]